MTTKSKGRSCAGKRRHPSKAAAKSARASLVRSGLAYPGQMSVYACAHCGGWHVGHKPRRRR